MSSAFQRGLARAYHNARWRNPRVPRFRATTEKRKRGTAWFVTPDWNRPSGGIRKQYRSVDVLNGAGISAAIVHHQSGFRCDWFRNDTRVVSARDLVVSQSDVVVLPEVYVRPTKDLPVGIRQVILNQNAYVTLERLASGDPNAAAPYVNNPDLVAVAAVSEHNAELLRYVFPQLSIHRIRWSLDPTIYFPAAAVPGRRLAYMPRRRAREAAQVLGLLKLRGALEGWEVIEITDCSESDAAEIMRASRLFLSFSEREGLGLPPLEAIACGCLVVGFTGYAGAEYFRPPFATAVEDGDVAQFAAEIERVMAWTERAPQESIEAARLGSQLVLNNYSQKVEEADIVGLFEPLLQ